jgi:hypothetical protein
MNTGQLGYVCHFRRPAFVLNNHSGLTYFGNRLLSRFAGQRKDEPVLETMRRDTHRVLMHTKLLVHQRHARGHYYFYPSTYIKKQGPWKTFPCPTLFDALGQRR